MGLAYLGNIGCSPIQILNPKRFTRPGDRAWCRRPPRDFGSITRALDPGLDGSFSRGLLLVDFERTKQFHEIGALKTQEFSRLGLIAAGLLQCGLDDR